VSTILGPVLGPGVIFIGPVGVVIPYVNARAGITQRVGVKELFLAILQAIVIAIGIGRAGVEGAAGLVGPTTCFHCVADAVAV
jgi:hypothetical protein